MTEKGNTNHHNSTEFLSKLELGAFMLAQGDAARTIHWDSRENLQSCVNAAGIILDLTSEKKKIDNGQIVKKQKTEDT